MYCVVFEKKIGKYFWCKPCDSNLYRSLLKKKIQNRKRQCHLFLSSNNILADNQKSKKKGRKEISN